MNLLRGRNRILLFLGVLLLLTFLGVSVLNYKVTRVDVNAQILRRDLPLTMDNIYSELSAELMEPLLVSTSMAYDSFLKEWVEEGEKNPERVLLYLNEIKKKYGFFTTFFVSENTQLYYRYNEIHKEISRQNDHDQWYYRFTGSGDEYVIEVDTDEGAENALTIFINYRVVNQQGKLLGVTGVGLKVENVAELIQHYQEKYQRTVYLADADGAIQVHPDTSVVGSASSIDGIKKISKEILNSNTKTRNFEFLRGGDRILLRVRSLEDLNWLLFVEQNDSEALRTARKNFIRTITIGFMVTTMVVVMMFVIIGRYQKKLASLAVFDELTGLANRRFFESEFQRKVSNYSRTGQSFSIVLMDLDGFKNVNDSMGHLAGDKVLGQVSYLLSRMIRPSDILSRWGGDEFVILCAGGLEEATVIAQRIRHAIAGEQFAGENSPAKDPRNQIKVSCGVVLFEEDDNLDRVMVKADRALYKAKARGGDCIDFIDGEDTQV